MTNYEHWTPEDYEYEIEHLERTVEALTYENYNYRTARAVDLLSSVCDALNADPQGEVLDFLNPELIELSKKLELCKKQQTEDRNMMNEKINMYQHVFG